jgi:DNA-binding MurR/RpiR family transcriptional regulator
MLVQYIQTHPEESYSSIAQMLHTSASTITRIAQRAGLPSRSGNRLTIADVEKLEVK